MKEMTIRYGSVTLTEHDTSKTLGDPALVFETFVECLAEGDHQSALEVLAGGLRHMKKTRLQRRYHIPRRTIYNLLDAKCVPSLALVAKVCKALRLEAQERNAP